jgi:hypothetical protein
LEGRAVDSIDFTLNGVRHTLTRESVIRAMKRQTPGRIQTYAVEVDGIWYPVKQALAQALGVPVRDFISTRAQELLAKLDFRVVNVEEEDADVAAPNVPPRPMTHREDALQLAVQLFAGRPDADIAKTLEAAAAFVEFMA